jgi:hypothetical protein
MGPPPDQAGTQILQPGQLDLQFAFMTSCTLTEYFQNYQGTVIHWKPNMSLQVSLLSRAERLVKQYFGGAMLLSHEFNFIRFATAYEQSSIRGTSLTGQAGNRTQACSFGQKT